ncbi:hypothetical protein DERF_000469 [Dermatophagoides farinae]|uniref:Uncharacterized protein n=1 Tax=Dermatophagoides farinae TaxID=6954 RepID=A0A922I9Y8_DERFA|nr:hypothetical protein DERF_000469 [Dermatophagoides farinae]
MMDSKASDDVTPTAKPIENVNDKNQTSITNDDDPGSEGEYRSSSAEPIEKRSHFQSSTVNGSQKDVKKYLVKRSSKSPINSRSRSPRRYVSMDNRRRNDFRRNRPFSNFRSRNNTDRFDPGFNRNRRFHRNNNYRKQRNYSQSPSPQSSSRQSPSTNGNVNKNYDTKFGHNVKGDDTNNNNQKEEKVTVLKPSDIKNSAKQSAKSFLDMLEEKRMMEAFPKTTVVTVEMKKQIPVKIPKFVNTFNTLHGLSTLAAEVKSNDTKQKQDSDSDGSKAIFNSSREEGEIRSDLDEQEKNNSVKKTKNRKKLLKKKKAITTDESSNKRSGGEKSAKKRKKNIRNNLNNKNKKSKKRYKASSSSSTSSSSDSSSSSGSESDSRSSSSSSSSSSSNNSSSHSSSSSSSSSSSYSDSSSSSDSESDDASSSRSSSNSSSSSSGSSDHKRKKSSNKDKKKKLKELKKKRIKQKLQKKIQSKKRKKLSNSNKKDKKKSKNKSKHFSDDNNMITDDKDQALISKTECQSSANNTIVSTIQEDWPKEMILYTKTKPVVQFSINRKCKNEFNDLLPRFESYNKSTGIDEFDSRSAISQSTSSKYQNSTPKEIEENGAENMATLMMGSTIKQEHRKKTIIPSEPMKLDMNHDYEHYYQYYRDSGIPYIQDENELHLSSHYCAYYRMLNSYDYNREQLTKWSSNLGLRLIETNKYDHMPGLKQETNGQKESNNENDADIVSIQNIKEEIKNEDEIEDKFPNNQTNPIEVITTNNISSTISSDYITYPKLYPPYQDSILVEPSYSPPPSPPPSRPIMTVLETSDWITLPNGVKVAPGTKQIIVHPYNRPIY